MWVHILLQMSTCWGGRKKGVCKILAVLAGNGGEYGIGVEISDDVYCDWFLVYR